MKKRAGPPQRAAERRAPGAETEARAGAGAEGPRRVPGAETETGAGAGAGAEAPQPTGAGVLYLVATPLGNLGDLTPRAAATFGQVDFIAAEDTRVTLKLLNHLGLKKPLVSYHAHNQKGRGGPILQRIGAGESCALCTDAGMPAISDPGQQLVAGALERGIRVVPVPAASAAVTALAVSGQESGRFCFEGFLPAGGSGRRQRLAELAAEERTLIFYEAPHKLAATLADLLGAFGDRGVTFCRELTKLHEEVWKTTLSAGLARYSETPPKGEFVLVVAGAEPQRQACSLGQAAARAKQLADGGLSAAAASRQAAAESGLAKSAIYKQLLQLQQGERR